MKINQWFPSDSRFNFQNFQFQPIGLISKIYRWIIFQEYSHLNRLANLTAPIGLVSSQSKEAKIEHFNPYRSVLKKLEGSENMTQKTAQIFVAELKSGSVPAWVLAMGLDLETFHEVSDSG